MPQEFIVWSYDIWNLTTNAMKINLWTHETNHRNCCFFRTDAPIDARTDAQKSLSAAVGSTVSLVCAVDANPVASYEWYRNNRLVSNQRIYTFTLGSLELLGSYTCRATNSRGSVQLQYTLSQGILTIYHFSHQCFSLFIIRSIEKINFW